MSIIGKMTRDDFGEMAVLGRPVSRSYRYKYQDIKFNLPNIFNLASCGSWRSGIALGSNPAAFIILCAIKT